MGSDTDFKRRSDGLVQHDLNDELAGNSSFFTRMWKKKKMKTVRKHAKPDTHVEHKAHKDESHEEDHEGDRHAGARSMWSRILSLLNLHMLDQGHFYLRKTVEELLPVHLRDNHQSDDIKNGLVQVRAVNHKWMQLDPALFSSVPKNIRTLILRSRNLEDRKHL